MEEDKAIWTATKLGCYSCAATCEDLRTQADTVQWWKLLWFQFTIPRHAFIGCLVIKNRLSTGKGCQSGAIMLTA